MVAHICGSYRAGVSNIRECTMVCGGLESSLGELCTGYHTPGGCRQQFLTKCKFQPIRKVKRIYICQSPTGSADNSVLCALWNGQGSLSLLASIGDASGYGGVGACFGPGLPSGCQFAARILVSLSVPGQAVSIGCAHKSRIFLIRLRWFRLIHAHGGGGQQNPTLAICL